MSNKSRAVSNGSKSIPAAILILISIAVFVIIVVAMAILRITVSDKFEIKSTDMLVAVIPIAIWLILSGKVKVFEFAGLKIESAFAEASRAKIAPYDINLPAEVDSIRIGAKGSLQRIPQLIIDRIEALSFELGYAEYEIIEMGEYFRYLSRQPFFRHIIINRSNGTFVGMANARELYTAPSAVSEAAEDKRIYDKDRDEHNAPQANYSPFKLAGWLRESNTKALADNLPGYISAEDAIKEDTDKQTALAQMEKLDVEVLPVVDGDGKFAGVVERSRLVSSLIIDVAGKMK
ncbi:CBS domain-containing protein [Candidatus Poribacteria bacterium]